MTASQHQMVAEFANTFGHPVHSRPVAPDFATRQLRLDLLTEEYDELIEAAKTFNLTDFADADVDIAYVLHGTLHTYGIPYDPSVVDRPMGINEAVWAYIEAEKVLLAEHIGRPTLTLSERARWETTIHRTINQILVECRVTARQFHLPFRELFAEVHASNMSKLGEDGKPIYGPNGKVLKGPNYFKPDIAGILIKAGHAELAGPQAVAA
jgi:predicted HAD superfamily Cof-like phosphohydrolase